MSIRTGRKVWGWSGFSKGKDYRLRANLALTQSEPQLGGGMPPVTDAIDEEAWLSIANLHGLRLKVIQHVRPRRRSSAGYQRG